MNTQRTRGPLIAAGAALGIGMGGFVDGIVLHQLLQVHNMLSAKCPTRGIEAEQLVVHLPTDQYVLGRLVSRPYVDHDRNRLGPAVECRAPARRTSRFEDVAGGHDSRLGAVQLSGGSYRPPHSAHPPRDRNRESFGLGPGVPEFRGRYDRHWWADGGNSV